MNDKLEAILALVQLAATLTGQERAAKLIEVFQVGAAEYQQITGRPVDWSTLHEIPEIT